MRLSANLPRYDIYMAAREAIEEAYKQGLVERRYIPVSRENLFDKLAAYQPLDSAEYAELERLVVSDFSRPWRLNDWWDSRWLFAELNGRARTRPFSVGSSASV